MIVYRSPLIQGSLALILFSSSAPLLLAADALPEGERIVVSATRKAESLTQVPATVQVLGKDEVERLAAEGASLGDLLGRLVPGLGAPTQSVSSYGQTLRGREALIVIDGIPQSENRQVSRQLNTIRPEMIERVEIVSGANAVYGSGAPGGVIHIFTRQASDENLAFRTKLGLSLAERPLDRRSAVFDASQEVSGSLESFYYLLAVGAESTANSFDARGRQIAPEPAQTSRGDTLTQDALLKLGWNLGGGRSLSLNAQALQAQQDTDYYAASSPYRAESGLELERQPRSERYQLALDYSQADFLGQQLTTSLYARSRLYRFFPFAITQPVPLVNQSESEATIAGLRFNLAADLTEALALVWGVDYEQEKGEQRARSYDYTSYAQSGGRVYENPSAPYDYGPDVDTEKTGLFGQFRWQMAQDWQSRFGLRYEWIQQTVHSFDPPLETALARNWDSILTRAQQLEAAGQVPSGTRASLPASYPLSRFPGGELDYAARAFNVGLTHDLSPQQSVFGQVSQGYDLADTARLMRDAVSEGSLLPQIGPLFRLSLTSSTVDDLEASTIETTHYEAGWRGIWSAVSGNFAIFYNQSDKTYQFNRDFTVDLLDQKKRIYGYEANFNWRLSEGFNWGSSYSSSKGESENAEGSGWEALPAVEVAPAKWTIFGDYALTRAWLLRLQYAQLSDYTASEIDIEGYGLLDALVSYTSDSAGRVQVGLENLAGTSYQTVFHQWAEATYGPSSGARGSGRRLSLTYLVDF